MKDLCYASRVAILSFKARDEVSNISARIIDGIRREECSAVEEMYCLLGRGVRWYLTRRLGPKEAEGKVFEVLLVVLRAIRDGSLREPDRLLGFVRTVTSRAAAEGVKPDPKSPLDRHSIILMKKVLNELSEKDRNILIRFYLRNQTQQQICEELNVTVTH